MRALQKDPAYRFADADEFIVALEQARGIPPGTGEYTRVAPHTGTYPGLPGAVAELEAADRRNLRWLWWLLLVLALIGIGIGAYAAAQAREALGAGRGRAALGDRRADPPEPGLRGERRERALRRRARGPRHDAAATAQAGGGRRARR